MSSGRPAARTARARRRVWGCTPSTAEIDQHDAVEHAQRPLDLGDEVGVAGGVDEVDREVVQLERDDRGLDGDAAGPLQLQGVGLRRALVDAADRCDDAGLEEDAFGEARLTGVDMRQDPDVDNRHARTLSLKKLPIAGLFNDCRMGRSFWMGAWRAFDSVPGYFPRMDRMDCSKTSGGVLDRLETFACRSSLMCSLAVVDV